MAAFVAARTRAHHAQTSRQAVDDDIQETADGKAHEEQPSHADAFDDDGRVQTWAVSSVLVG